MSSLQRTVIARIHTLLERKAWSRKRLQREAGFANGYIYLLLSGHFCPTFEAIDKLEKALGAPILTIAGRPPKKAKSKPDAIVIDEFSDLLDAVD